MAALPITAQRVHTNVLITAHLQGEGGAKEKDGCGPPRGGEGLGGFLFSLSLPTTDNMGCSKYGLVEQIHTRPGTKRDHPCDRYVSRAVAVIATGPLVVV